MTELFRSFFILTEIRYEIQTKTRKKSVFAIYLLIFLWFVIIGLSVCRWCGFFGLVSDNPVGEIFGALFAALFITVLFRLRFLDYVVDKKQITLSLFGIRLTKIRIDAVWKILILEDSLIVCHTVNNTDTTITSIFIKKTDFDAFAETVKGFNNRIIVTDGTDDDTFPDENNGLKRLNAFFALFYIKYLFGAPIRRIILFLCKNYRKTADL